MNRKRVQKLRDVIAGIPPEKIKLNTVISGDRTPCGSVACILGWSFMYPPFIDAGIGDKGACAFFGISSGLFSFRQRGERGTHKQIALARLDKLLGMQP